MFASASKLLKQLGAVLTKNVVSSSGKGALNGADILKLVRSALFVGTSAGLLFCIQNLADTFLSSAAQGVAIVVVNTAVEAVFRRIKNNEVIINDSTKPKVE